MSRRSVPSSATATSHPSSDGRSLLHPIASVPIPALAQDMRAVKVIATGQIADLIHVQWRRGSSSQSRNRLIEDAAVKRLRVPVFKLSRSEFVFLSNELRLCHGGGITQPMIDAHPNVLSPRRVWIDSSTPKVEEDGALVFSPPSMSGPQAHPSLCILYNYPVASDSITRQHTTLEEFIRTFEGLSQELATSLFVQALCGLRHLHGYRPSPLCRCPASVHGDIKPLNILLSSAKVAEPDRSGKGGFVVGGRPLVNMDRDAVQHIVTDSDGRAYTVALSYMFTLGGAIETGYEPITWARLISVGPPESSQTTDLLPPTPLGDVWRLGACMAALLCRRLPLTNTLRRTFTPMAHGAILKSLSNTRFSVLLTTVVGDMITPSLLDRPTAHNVLYFSAAFVGEKVSTRRTLNVGRGVEFVMRRLSLRDRDCCVGGTENCTGSDPTTTTPTTRVTLAPPLGFALPFPLPIKQIPLLDSDTVGAIDWGATIAVEANPTMVATTGNPLTAVLQPLLFRGRDDGEGWLRVIRTGGGGEGDREGAEEGGYVLASIEGDTNYSEDGTNRYSLFQPTDTSVLDHVRRNRRQQMAALSGSNNSSVQHVAGLTVIGTRDASSSLGTFSSTASVQTSSMGSAREFLAYLTVSSTPASSGSSSMLMGVGATSLEESFAHTDAPTQQRALSGLVSRTSSEGPPPPPTADSDPDNRSASPIEPTTLSPIQWDVLSTLSPEVRDLTASGSRADSQASSSSVGSHKLGHFRRCHSVTYTSDPSTDSTVASPPPPHSGGSVENDTKHPTSAGRLGAGFYEECPLAG